MRYVWLLSILAAAGYGIGQLLAPVLRAHLRARRCDHDNVRCVHGDEIDVRDARAICRSCGKALKKEPLPYICSVTGHPHPSAQNDGSQADG